MSADSWLHRLQATIEQHRPALMRYLNPGLPERQRVSLLRRFHAPDQADVLADLYRWRDGTRLTPEFADNPSLLIIPEVPFHFIDLEMAVAHFSHGRAAALQRVKMRPYADRLLPCFWDGDRRWICVDATLELAPVFLAEHDADTPYEPLYSGFIEFIEDTIAGMVSGTCPPRMKSLAEA